MIFIRTYYDFSYDVLTKVVILTFRYLSYGTWEFSLYGNRICDHIYGSWGSMALYSLQSQRQNNKALLVQTTGASILNLILLIDSSISNVSDETEREKIREETHQLEDAEQDELEEDDDHYDEDETDQNT